MQITWGEASLEKTVVFLTMSNVCWGLTYQIHSKFVLFQQVLPKATEWLTCNILNCVISRLYCILVVKKYVTLSVQLASVFVCCAVKKEKPPSRFVQDRIKFVLLKQINTHTKLSFKSMKNTLQFGMPVENLSRSTSFPLQNIFKQLCIKSEWFDTVRNVCQTTYFNHETEQIQWNLFVTTISKIKVITCDLFSNVFEWRLKEPSYSC